MKKNLTRRIYKNLIVKFFFLIYGKVVNKKYNFETIIIKNVDKIDSSNVKKFNYKIFKIKNGRVFTNYVESLAIISKKSLVKEVSYQQIRGKLYKSKNQVIKTGTPKFLKKVSGKIMILSQGVTGHFNYAHWLFDIVPKIKILSTKYDITDINFFYFSKLKKFQVDTLKFFKINPNKIIDSNKLRHVIATELYAVTHPNYFKDTVYRAHSNLPIWIIIYIRKFFLNKIKKRFNYDNIYIDRSDSTQNHCKPINNQYVIRLLKDKNFKILKLSKLSIFDQVSIFNNCKKVVAPHGAGLANLAFCKKSTKVIEFNTNKNKNNKVYERISRINKLNYRSFYCKNINDNKNGDMYIDLNILKKYI